LSSSPGLESSPSGIGAQRRNHLKDERGRGLQTLEKIYITRKPQGRVPKSGIAENKTLREQIQKVMREIAYNVCGSCGRRPLIVGTFVGAQRHCPCGAHSRAAAG
jgi:hypothetical protein